MAYNQNVKNRTTIRADLLKALNFDRVADFIRDIWLANEVEAMYGFGVGEERGVIYGDPQYYFLTIHILSHLTCRVV